MTSYQDGDPIITLEKNMKIAQALGEDWGWNDSWASHKNIALFAGIASTWKSNPAVDPDVYYVRGWLGCTPIAGIGLTPMEALGEFQKELNKAMRDAQEIVKATREFELLSKAAHESFTTPT